MKKKLMVSIAGHLLVCVIAQAQNFVHNFAEAQEKAQTLNKTVLMIFSGSDWCKPCIQLRKNILEHPTFTQYSDKYLVLLELDFPYKKKNRLSKEQQQHNEQMAERYNPQGSFPLLLLLNQKGEVIHKMDFDKRLGPEDYLQRIQQGIQQS